MNFDTTFPKARKGHRCYLCGKPIEKGEKHRKDVGKYYGDFYSMRTHIGCFELTGDWEEADWECFDEGEFNEMKEARGT